MRIEETGSVSDESLQDPSISGTGISLTTNRKRRRKTTDEVEFDTLCIVITGTELFIKFRFEQLYQIVEKI